MELDIKIKMNEKLFLRDPYDSPLGRRIVNEGLALINEVGFEAFTFKKLAQRVKTTEAGVYRYFENKHRLLVYLITWYWSFLEFKVVFSINNIGSPEAKLKTIVALLSTEPDKRAAASDFISEWQAYQLVKWEASKTFLTRSVTKDNKNRLFKPYKDLSARIAQVIREVNPHYPYPNFLASTLLEMSHAQKFFMENLPALSDAGKNENEKLVSFLEDLIFGVLKKHRRK